MNFSCYEIHCLIVWTFEKSKRLAHDDFTPVHSSTTKKRDYQFSFILGLFEFKVRLETESRERESLPHFKNSTRARREVRTRLKISNKYWKLSQNNEMKYSLSRSTFESWHFQARLRDTRNSLTWMRMQCELFRLARLRFCGKRRKCFSFLSQSNSWAKLWPQWTWKSLNE